MDHYIFISYKSEQREYAIQIHDALKSWGLDPWLDVYRLQPGDEWGNEIDQALKNCRTLLGIMTPMSIASRYVTNEWDLAIMKGKLFIPLLFEATEPHYKYIDIQYIDFSHEDKSKPLETLRKRLSAGYQAAAENSDPYGEYLQQLYDRINKYLEQKIITSLRNENRPEPIRLQSQTDDHTANFLGRSEQIDPLFFAGGIQNDIEVRSPQVYDDLGKAFSHFDGRVLLLGAPGAGKTITLLHYTRDLIVQRKQNPALPLPILGMIYTWESSNWKPISEWLAQSYGAPANTSELIKEGKAVLMLDGLDELGSKRPVDSENPSGPTFDPRQRFLQMLPENNQAMITCRTHEFLQTHEKAPVNGIITLKPLGDAQVRQYLHKQPELLALIESDSGLKNWLSTPLLLSFFSFAYEGMDVQSKQALKQLRTAYELRQFIFDEYIKQRFQHEARKASIRKETLPHTLDEIQSFLSDLALKGLVVFWEYDIEAFPESMKPMVHTSYLQTYCRIFGIDRWDGLSETAAREPLSFTNDEQSRIDLAVQLNLLISSDEAYHFPHILLRNHLAYREALRVLEDMKPAIHETMPGISYRAQSGNIRIVENKSFDIIQAIVALRVLNDSRAIPSLQPYLAANGAIIFGYHESADVSSEAVRAIASLQVAAKSGESPTNSMPEDPLY